MVGDQLRLKMFTMIMRALFILLYRWHGQENYMMVQDLEKDYKRFVARPVVVEEEEED